MFQKKLLIILLFFFYIGCIVFPLKSFAQIPPDVIVDNARVSLNKIDTTDFPKVKLTVSVTDNNGKPLDNLAKQDFIVLEDGKEQNIIDVKTVKSAKSQLSILLILDISSSMTGSPLNSLKESAKEFINLLPSDWEIGLIVFNSTVTKLSDFTSNKDSLYAKIDSLYASTRTALFDAIMAGIELSENEPNIGAIIVFTDGVENESRKYKNKNDFLPNVTSLNFPIYSIGYIGGDGIDKETLTDIATRSNGKYYFSPSLDEIKDIYNLIPNILESQYEITYSSSFQGKKGEDIKTGVLIKDPITGKWIEGEKQYVSPKTVESKDVPVIIIPGIMGSLPVPTIDTFTNILSNYDEPKDFLTPGIKPPVNFSKLLPPQYWGKGDSGVVITPLMQLEYYDMIRWLKEFGGYNSRTLYLYPYNWALPNEISAYYLKQKIDQVKKVTGASRVDILAHSMGGLVARAYIEGFAEDEGKKAPYKNDVRYLIMLGTPNQGSVKSYYTFEGGEYKSPCNNSVINKAKDTVLNAIIFAFARMTDITMPRVQYVQNYVKSTEQLLPVHYDYIKNGSSYPENKFLENLNSAKIPVGTKYIIIRGMGNETAKTLTVKQTSNNSALWQHGEPSDSECVLEGDGTVLESDAILQGVPESSVYTFNEDHGELVCNKEIVQKIIKILTNKDVVITSPRIKDQGNINKTFSFASIMFLSPCNAIVTSPDGTSMGYNPNTSEFSDTLENALYYGPNGDGAEAFFLLTPEDGKYKLSVYGTGDGEVHTLVNFVSDNGEFQKELGFNIKNGEEKTLYLTLNRENPQKSYLAGSLNFNNKYIIFFVLLLVGAGFLVFLIYFTTNKPVTQIYYLFDGSRYYQVKDGMDIGRSSSSYLHINDPKVSKNHARISVKGAQIIVQDLESTNGTFVNKLKVKSALLKSGDHLKIGSKELIVLSKSSNFRADGYFSLIYNKTQRRFNKKAVIGRNPNQCNFVISDPLVSQIHAEISFDGKNFIIKDLGSKNGIFVNGTKITTPVLLRNGDKIKIGKDIYEFIIKQ